MTRRRHLLVWIRVTDPTDQLAARDVSRRDHAHRLVAEVQPQIPLPVLLVGAVAREAVVRQDRAHVAVEVDGARSLLGCRTTAVAADHRLRAGSAPLRASSTILAIDGSALPPRVS